MHLVFLNQYYPPDAAPTGVMLEGLVQGLVDAGHEVTVLCAAGGYAEAGAGAGVGVSENRCFSESVGSDTPKHRNTASPTIHRIRASRFGRGTFHGKLLDYLSYYLGTGWKLLTMGPRPDRIVALTTPPYLSVLARLVSKVRGADHAHWVMDLYPDVMVAHGIVAENGLIYRILAGLARWGFGGTRCAAVVTLGPDMAERVGRYVKQRQHNTTVTWVPLWGAGEDRLIGTNIEHRTSNIEHRRSDVEHRTSNIEDRTPTPLYSARALELRRARGWDDDDLVVMYSGNMGLGHRFGEILAAAGMVESTARVARGLGIEDESPILATSASTTPIPNPLSSIHDHPAAGQRLRFVFFGGGKRREEIVKYVRENPGCAVEVHDYARAEQLSEHLQSADVHLASLDAVWTGTMVPSKVQGIFGAGRPVIFIGSSESSIGRWVVESGGGWVLQPGDISSLLAALSEARNPAVRLTRGRAALSFAEAHFNMAANVARLTKVFEGHR
jgi:hypothetical protein